MTEEDPSILFHQLMIPCYAPHPVAIARALGSNLWDISGKNYIDFSAGFGVNALGYSHPELQSKLMLSTIPWHVGNNFLNVPALKLAEKLCNLSFSEKVFFSNSGTEANEAALKLARKYTTSRYGPEKVEFIGFRGGFHGRSLLTIALGGQVKYTQGFEPLPLSVQVSTFNDLDEFESRICNRTSAVIIEPVLGNGGIFPAKKSFLKGVRELCDHYGALLVFDEVQTGIGRSGRFFSYMEYGVIPDILTLGKALGGGLPLAAVLTTSEIAKAFSLGTHGSTMGGNSLASTLGSTIVDIVSDTEFLRKISSKHILLKSLLVDLNEKMEIFEDIRGSGLLIGCELSRRIHLNSREISKLLMQHGVVVSALGNSVLRISPALNIDDREIEDGVNRMGKAFLSIY